MRTFLRRTAARPMTMAVVALLAFAACKGDSTSPPTLTKLTVTTAAQSVTVGQTTTATAAGVDQSGASISAGTVTWSVGSSAIASVNASTGAVTGVAPGSTQIIATSGTVSGEATITVVQAPAVLTTISVALPNASLQFGQTTTASAVGLDQYGKPITAGTVTWSTSAATIAAVNATTGLVTGVSAGTAQISAAAGGKTSVQTVTVLAPPALRINEVESNGGTPGDWIELYNASTAAIDLSGWGVRDNDSTHVIYKIPAGTSLPAGGYYVVEEAQFGFGLGAPDEARLYNSYGALIELYGWTAHATTTYGRCVSGQGAFVTTTTSTKGAANDCRPTIKINEVESNGGTPGDWIELINTGTATVDLSGFFVKDNDDTRNVRIPAGTTLAPGAYYVLEEAFFVFGLGAPDAARIYDASGVLVDSLSWTAHATTTYGRCPNGTGDFATTTTSTKGAANDCGGAPPPPPPAAAAPWPGSDDVTTVDGLNVFGGNLSGLMYETAKGAQPNVLWGIRNGPGSLFRLIFSGSIWTPDPANGWGTGKLLTYPDGTGEPDAEGVTFTTGGSTAGMYVSAERNNQNNSVSRISVLRFDPTATGTTLRATNEWNLTSDLPVSGANLGAEAIAWIPDDVLVAKKFFDEKANKTYNPADYANHGTGIFFVGLESNGNVYAFALNHADNSFTRIATIATGYPTGVMDLNFDPATNYLWAVCDDGCGGTVGILEIESNAALATFGRFRAPRRFARPSTMPNINNEGFAMTTQAECVNGSKPVFWADDSETGGHAIRRATLPCGAIVSPAVQGLRATTAPRR